MNSYRLPNGDLELGDWPSRRDENWVNIVWLITNQCNLGCPYCIGVSSKGRGQSLLDRYSPDEIADAFKDLGERAGKKLYLIFTGGEPTIVPGFADLCAKLAAAGVTLDLQTNLTSKWVQEYFDKVPPESTAQVMAAYHGWKLDNSVSLRRRYFNNARGGIDRGFPVVPRVIAEPDGFDRLQKRLALLRDNLPAGTPIYVKYFVSGAPPDLDRLDGVYPYAYTESEIAVLDQASEVARAEQHDFSRGAGFFKGMECDAGRGLLYMDTSGKVFRCMPTRNHSCLGTLMERDVNILSGPTPCPVNYCECPPQGLRFGKDPWDYIPGARKEDAYYCRFGPEVP